MAWSGWQNRRMAWDEADLEQARRKLNKDVYVVVHWAVNERRFTLRKQGHAYALYCPCGGRKPFIRVDGTPRNPTWYARRLKRAVNHCPDHHELMPLL